MYEQFFGLRERPFDLTPNPRFLLMTPGHREALSTVQYGIRGRKGVTLLVGPAGTGKTTLVNAALEGQEGKSALAIVVSNPTLTREEFIELLSLEVGLSAAAASSKTRFLRELTETLREWCAAGNVAALIVDEAQAMPDALLEEVRLLANMETRVDKLLPVVLVGQLELAARLNSRPLQQLKQRIALRATLAPLTAHQTASYIAERIRVAGGDVRTVFTPDAVAAVYDSSGGIPRIISVICDNALVSGFALDQRPIGRGIIVEVCRDFDLPVPAVTEPAPAEFIASAVALTHEPAPAAPPPPVPVPDTQPRILTMPGPIVQIIGPAPLDTAAATPDSETSTEPSAPERRRGLLSLFARTGSR